MTICIVITRHMVFWLSLLGLASAWFSAASPRPRQCCLGLVKTASPTSLKLTIVKNLFIIFKLTCFSYIGGCEKRYYCFSLSNIPSYSHSLPSSPFPPSPLPFFSPFSPPLKVRGPENFEILHCCSRVLARFRSKKYGFWLKVLAPENIEYSCDWPKLWGDQGEFPCW